MKKKLVINSEPRIRSYTYHCFYHAIISGEDKVSRIPAIVVAKDFSSYTWKEQMDQLDWVREGDTITYQANKWNIGMNHCFYRECQEIDEINIQVDKQIYANAWGAINVFVTDEAQTDMLNDDNYLYKFGNYCKEGIYLKIHGKELYCSMRREEGSFALVLKKDKIHYTFLVRHDKEEKVIYEWEENRHFENQRIGFEVKLENNAFFEWYFAHYIQIYGDILSNSIRLDYLVNPIKNWYTYETNNFTQYRTIDREKISVFGLSILEYVKACINAEQYVEMWLNEGFMDRINGKPGDVHIHQNLIYGYDDDMGVLNVLRTKNGIPTLVTLKYEEFESRDNFCERYQIIVPTQYRPEYIAYELTAEYLIHLLKSYYESKNLYYDLKFCAEYSNKTWGMQMLIELLTQRGIDIVLEDIRVSHLLYERATCMYERINYLAARNLLTEEEEQIILPAIKEALSITSIIRNLVIKQRFAKNSKYAESIREKLEDLYRIEKDYIPKLIKMLESKVYKEY